MGHFVKVLITDHTIFGIILVFVFLNRESKLIAV